jgi:hypothetical protein
MLEQKAKEFITKYNALCAEFSVCIQPNLQVVEFTPSMELNVGQKPPEPSQVADTPPVEPSTMPVEPFKSETWDSLPPTE